MLVPTMPPPMITTWARSGTSAAMLASVGLGAVPSPLWSEEILFTFRALPVVGPGPGLRCECRNRIMGRL